MDGAGVEGVEGALGAGVVVAGSAVLGAWLGAGVLTCGGRRSAGTFAAGSATPETCSCVEGSDSGAGWDGAFVLPALALPTANAAANATTATSAAIATRPRGLAVIRRTRASSFPAPGIAGLS